MSQNVTIAGASYTDVPSITVPKTGGGTASFTDVTDTTAIASDVRSGRYFYTASGVFTEGTGSGGGSTLITKTITENGTYDAQDDEADGYSSVTAAIPNPFAITDVSNTTGTTAAVTAGGGSAPATQHIISFVFSDTTSADINLYYDDALLSAMITSYIPVPYSGKNIVTAELDGVEWYNNTGIPTSVQLVDFSTIRNGYVISESTGGEIVSAYSCCSDYILVNPTKTFRYVGYDWYDIDFYDSGKNFLGYLTIHSDADSFVNAYNNVYGIGTLTPDKFPTNTAYVRINSTPVNPDSVAMSLICSEEIWEPMFSDTVVVEQGGFWLPTLSAVYPTEGSVWRITLNGVEYVCTAVVEYNQWQSPEIYVGNPVWAGYQDDGSDVPFCLANFGYGAWNGWSQLPDGNYTLKIEHAFEESGTWELLYSSGSAWNEVDRYFWIIDSTLTSETITDGSVWRITFYNYNRDDVDVSYTCMANYYSGGMDYVLGNPKYSGGLDNGSELPFFAYNTGQGAWVIDNDYPSGTYWLTIEKLTTS